MSEAAEQNANEQYEELVRYIARTLLETDDFEVSTSTRRGQTTITLKTPEELRGRVIGKGGRIARAIRTLIDAAAFADEAPQFDIVD